eukprot:5632414-Pyramimonas_sp.AAC.1
MFWHTRSSRCLNSARGALRSKVPVGRRGLAALPPAPLLVLRRAGARARWRLGRGVAARPGGSRSLSLPGSMSCGAPHVRVPCRQ